MNEWDFFQENTQLSGDRSEWPLLQARRSRCACPHGKADIFDLVLAGRLATIEAIEQDLENNIHFAVVLEDDPAKIWGCCASRGIVSFLRLMKSNPLKAG